MAGRCWRTEWEPYQKWIDQWNSDKLDLRLRFIPDSERDLLFKAADVVVGRTYDLKETTKDLSPRWSLATNSLLYKLAVATEVIKAGEPLSKGDIGNLIGKAALFEARIWIEDGYKQEKISFKGEVPEGMPVPEYDESILYYINLNSDNDEEHVKQLRRSVRNTIKRSVSYEGSKLQAQYDHHPRWQAKGSRGGSNIYWRNREF